MSTMLVGSAGRGLLRLPSLTPPPTSSTADRWGLRLHRGTPTVAQLEKPGCQKDYRTAIDTEVARGIVGAGNEPSTFCLRPVVDCYIRLDF